MRHEFIPYAIAFREPVTTGAGEWVERRGAWLRLEADDGRVGLGEAAPLGRVETAATLEQALAQGPFRDAAFDLDALDLEAQHFGRPLAWVLSDAPRAQVAVNAMLFAPDARSLAEEAARAVSAGFRTLKVKVAAAPPEVDIARILAVRERVGAGVAIRIDANGAWDEETALSVLRAVEGCDIEYVEDPVAGDLRAVGRRINIPVAADPATLEEKFFGTNSNRLESYSFTAPVAYTLELLMLWSDQSRIVTFGIAGVLGMLAGSAAYALASRTFRWEGFGSVEDVANHIVGGILMGFGGVTALGCTIGQGLTGISTLAFGSILAFVSIIGGCVAAVRYQEWRLSKMA